LVAAAIASPLLCAHALISGRALPTFLELLGPQEARNPSPLTWFLGIALVAAALIGAETALGFVFDPRYKDFPFAALTMAVVPFATLLLNRPPNGVRPIAEATFAGLLALSAIYIGFNEGRDNWQSLWTCAMYLLFAVTLWQARAAQIPK
jgi:glucan 1,3-beta-glucosidase